MNDFFHKKIVVTGGAAGIGKGLVTAFASEGGTVVFCDIDRASGEAVCREIRESTGNQDVLFFAVDLSQENEIARFIQNTISIMGNVDVLVNNVGENFAEGTILEHSLDSFDKTYNLNLRSAVQCAQGFLPGMVKQKMGSIIFISSTMSLGARGFSAYSMSKGAMNSLMVAMALDHAHENIRVNAVAPGLIATKRTQPWIDSQKDAASAKGIPMKTIGTTEDVSNAVLFLASEKARYITGQVLVVDGGLTIGE